MRAPGEMRVPRVLRPELLAVAPRQLLPPWCNGAACGVPQAPGGAALRPSPPGTCAAEGPSGPERRSAGSCVPTEEELRKLREETNAELLRQELDRERQRRMELEQKVQEVLKAR